MAFGLAMPDSNVYSLYGTQTMYRRIIRGEHNHSLHLTFVCSYITMELFRFSFTRRVYVLGKNSAYYYSIPIYITSKES